MLKKSMLSALLMAACCLPVIADAATCRAGDAAQAGSTAGYEQAKRSADAWSQLEKTVSDQLQDCLSRVRSTGIALPNFPSLQDLLSQVAEKICKAAVDKINSHVPKDIDPWKNM